MTMVDFRTVYAKDLFLKCTKSMGILLVPLKHIFHCQLELQKQVQFYNKEKAGSQTVNGNVLTVPEGVDAELLSKVLANPEMVALLSSMAKAMKE